MAHDDLNNIDTDATRTTVKATGMLCADELLASRYRIIEPVGAGAMGAVYCAMDERLGVRVALKVLHTSVADDAGAMQRFESELRLARQVSHPNVVRIHDIGEHDHLSFLTMDLVDGVALSDLIARDGRLAPDRAARIAAGVAAGLAAAHSKGVVHRDLKPGNILIAQGDHACITDFGVAIGANAARLTQTGMFVGTPDYIAPEQARGEEVDGRCDIYALGLILYEMLAGRLPANAGSLQELIAQRTSGKLPDLRRLDPDTPVSLRRIMARCLQKEPARRYQDAAQLAQDLTDGKATSPPASPQSRIATGIAVFIAIAVAAFWWLDQADVGNPNTTSNAPPPDAQEVEEESVAVASGLKIALLPFSDQDQDPAMDWLSTGLIEALAVELNELEGLNVVSEARVRTTLSDLHIGPGPQAPEDARQLASLFAVDWLVAGSLIHEDGQIAVDVVMHSAERATADRALPRVAVDTARAGDLGAALAAALREVLSLPTPARQPMRLSGDFDAMRAYAGGVNLLALGDSVGAIEPLQKAVAIDPDFAAAWLKLAQAYDAQGRASDAADAIERSIDSGAGDTRLVEMAQIRHAAFNGEIEQARDQLQKIVDSEPGDGDARFMLAELTGAEGHFSVALEQLAALVVDDPNHPRAWYLLGKFAIQNGDSRQALAEFLPNALRIQEKLNNSQGRAEVLNAMGVAQHRIGELGDAKASYLAAAQTREEIGDQRGLAASLANIARIELEQGNYDDARRTLDRAIDVRSDLGDLAGIASLYNAYGVIEEERGDFRAALRRYRQALKIREDTGDLLALTNSYTNIAFAYFVLGEYDNAGVYWQRAVDQAVATDNPDARMLAEQSLGQLRLAEGDWALALELFLRTLKESRSSGFVVAEAVALGNLGRVAQRQGRYGAALSSYADALKILEKLGDISGLIEFTLWQADTYLELDDEAAAGAELDGAALLLEQAGDNEQRARLHGLRGQLAQRKGQTDVAAAAFQNALRHAGRTGSDVPVLGTMVLRAEAGTAGEVSDLDELVRNVLDLGNADLSLRVLLVQARAALARRSAADASAQLRTLLEYLDDYTPYGRAWEIHALAANIYGAAGDERAASHQLRAAAEVRRVMTDMPASAQPAFMEKVSRAGIELQ